MFKEHMAQNLLDFMKDSILNQETHVSKTGQIESNHYLDSEVKV